MAEAIEKDAEQKTTEQPEDKQYIELCPSVNIYPSEVVGMTTQQVLKSDRNTKMYVSMFLSHKMLVVKDGILAWPVKEEFRFSTTNEF